MPYESGIHPRTDITLTELNINKSKGIFGHYKSLTLIIKRKLPKNFKIYVQDLLAKKARDIAGKVVIQGNKIIIPGKLIDTIGTSAQDKGDISAPGMVLEVVD